ncbi:MAG: hypothetical protein KTR19_01800 [Hyphomicrobiales bacterium]|nr:hypothetical protein [Hyphomicrobiales bacterium]
MAEKDTRNVDKGLEAKLYQESLDFEDREQQRLDNRISPEEMILISIVLGLFGALVYYLWG